MYKRECDVMFNPPHPGEILREDYLKPLGLTVTQVARGIGVTRKAISDIINEKAGISPSMALKLAKAFDTSVNLWVGMQSDYELWHAKQKTNLDKIQKMCG